MNYLKFTQYVYLIAGFVFFGIAINDWRNGEDPWVFFAFGAVAIFMFFFRRRFARKFEDRNKKP
jgi:positive regulator of sigma E activity